MAVAALVLGLSPLVSSQAGHAAQAKPVVTSANRVITETENWAGYVAKAHGMTVFGAVNGVYDVPYATCSAGEYSSSSVWVGLGGADSTHLVQIGTVSECRDGRPKYYAWYQDGADGPEQRIGKAVVPGDHMQVNVLDAYGGPPGVAAIYDITQNWDTGVNLPAALPSSSSAECIVERDTNSLTHNLVPLTDFSLAWFHGEGISTSTCNVEGWAQGLRQGDISFEPASSELAQQLQGTGADLTVHQDLIYGQEKNNPPELADSSPPYQADGDFLVHWYAAK